MIIYQGPYPPPGGARVILIEVVVGDAIEVEIGGGAGGGDIGKPIDC